MKSLIQGAISTYKLGLACVPVPSRLQEHRYLVSYIHSSNVAQLIEQQTIYGLTNLANPKLFSLGPDKKIGPSPLPELLAQIQKAKYFQYNLWADCAKNTAYKGEQRGFLPII